MSGCENNAERVSSAHVKLVGTPGVAVEIFRLNGTTERVVDPSAMVPLGTIQSGKTYSFPPGAYYAVNTCSALFFDIKANEDVVIGMQVVELVLNNSLPIRFLDVMNPGNSKSARDLWRKHLETGETEESQDSEKGKPLSKLDLKSFDSNIAAECVHPLSGTRESYTDRTRFEILPGQVSLSAGGRLLIDSLLQNEQKVHKVTLVPIVVKSAIENVHSDFFATPFDEEKGAVLPVVSAAVGSVLWLPLGKYMLELNGTKREIDLSGTEGFAVSLGALELRIPKNFPLEERLKHGGQPPFAFINDGVLFTMDTPYLVFPGSYTVNLDQSDVRSTVTVFSGETTVVQTLGATIELPECPKEQKSSCKRPPGITIHAKQKPFVLMTVEPGIPFLVLNEEYEFGVEGVRGILKRLNASHEGAPKETLARVNIEWQVVQAAPKVRTDLVRLESKGEKLFGKSLDFLFTEPKEIYVPSGQYELTYLVGDPSTERSKIKKPLNLVSGSTADVQVPIYSDKSSPENDKTGNNRPGKSNLNENLPLPRKLKPMGK